MHAYITITGTQQLDGQEPDTVELTTAGEYSPTDDGWCLSYAETEATGMEGTATRLQVYPSRVVLERSGTNASVLVLEKHRRHHSNYETPYGILDIGTYATELAWELTPAGGTLDFAYTLDFNGCVHSKHTVHITVQEDKTPCPLS